ncbi:MULTISPECIES: hypothetical protein [Mesorhizobium]|nr:MULTISPECIES: hypothetical protein [Mesorhizobium]MDX8436497.1 hypothetical protein [Mesorhizobium abyssinicae]
MRAVLLILAVVAVFFIWDNLANEGRYSSAVERSYRLAVADLPTGYKR